MVLHVAKQREFEKKEGEMQPLETTLASTPMSPEENYHFDVAGYLIVRRVLSSEQLLTWNQALDQVDGDPATPEWPELYEHPALASYVEQLCGEDYLLDGRPWLLGDQVGDTPVRLTGGNEPLDWSRAYYQQNGSRYCLGLLAIWALTDVKAGAGGFSMVAASHKGCVETPEKVLSGTDDMGLTMQPVLEAGDLLLCAQTTLHAMRRTQDSGSQRLIACSFVGAEARRSAVAEEPAPAWMDELDPLQRAVMRRSSACPAPLLRSDGKTCQLEEQGGNFHPSIYIRNPDSDIDIDEFYHWDLCGHLVLQGVMDEAWLAAANAAIEACPQDGLSMGGDSARGSRRLAGTATASVNGLFELPQPHCQPFRAMIAHPAVVQRLNWMMGSGFFFGSARAMNYAQGSAGLFLHGGSEPARSRNHYALQNGRTYCESVNVAWQLGDVNEADGGFVCIPGSHKARYPVPPGVVSCDDEMGLVRHVAMKAGDVIFFLGAALTHGAYPWTQAAPRRTALINYKSRYRA
jgi:ectoine hydroxylase-related dioxygenase (phytanoyl-CoA dioxygenase family)